MSEAITLVELGLLVLAATPGMKLAADAHLRRLFPRAHRLVIVGLAVWVGGSVAVAVFAPVALHALAAAAAIAFLVASVRGHPRFGTRRGLPPGSLSVSSSIRSIADRGYYLEETRRHGPIFKAAQFHRPMVCVVGLERGDRLVREHSAALESAPLPFSEDVSGGFLRYMDDATHRRYGPALRIALAKPSVTGAEEAMEGVARHELDRMAAACAEARGPVQPGSYFEQIVQDCCLVAMFGVMPGTETHRLFEQGYVPVATQALGSPLSDEARRALESLRTLLLEHLAASGNGDVPVSALSELRRIDARLPDATCLDNLVFATRTGGENVVSLLRWIIEMLGRHPEWATRAHAGLVAGREGSDQDLIDRIVMETLRLAQREYLYRVLAEDIEYEGFRLPRGWLLRICVWESHRSAESFADPEAFDPDRFRSPTFAASAYSPFGRGQHACNGIPLTKSICRTVLRELLGGFDWAVTGTGPPERDFRHWGHWRPSSRLALELTPIQTREGTMHLSPLSRPPASPGPLNLSD